jgi:hypothetical protein
MKLHYYYYYYYYYYYCGLDVPFLKNVFSSSKYCFILYETVGLRVPNRNFRDFSLFNVDFKRPNCPSARWALAANGIGSDTDIINGRSVSVNIIG